MQLLKGLQRSKNRNKVTQGGWWDARNIVISDEYTDATNEEGFSFIDNKAGAYIGKIETDDSIIVFRDDSSTGEIGIYDRLGNYTCILRSADLNFSTDNPIEGVYTRNTRNELIILWWDGLADDANPPKILNVDCLPFEVNGNCEPTDPSKIDLIKLFPDIGCSDWTLNAVNNTGGSLPSGVFAFTYAYVLPDGSVTNHTGLSNWVSIIKDADSAGFINYDGTEANTPTSKSITLTLDNLNEDYSGVQIGVVKRIGGIISSVILDTITITGSSITFDYTGLADELDVDTGLLLTPTNSFTRVKTGTVLDDRLTFGNVKTQEALDLQPYANNIKANWYRAGDDINLATSKNSYKDPVILFDRKSFATDEVYSFYVWAKLKDGTFSDAFHIPNIAPQVVPGYGSLKENDLISSFNTAFPEARFAEALIVSNTSKFHEIFNSADNTGKMGYWENQDEVYPDEDCSDIKDATGTVIGTLRGEKVRHHKFPSIKQLEDWGNPYYDPSTGSAITREWEFDAVGFNSSGDNDKMDYSQVGGVTGFTVDQTTDGLYLTSIGTTTGTLRVGYNFSNLTVDIRIEVFLVKANGTGQTLYAEDYTEPSIFSPKQADFNFSKFITLNPGDQLRISVSILSNTILIQPTIDDSNIFFDSDGLAESDGVTKAMGVRFSDINIPDEIKEQIDCLYFGYATRSIRNSTKVGQTRFKENSLVQEINSFDIKLIEPPANYSYIKTQLRYTGGDLNNLVFNNTKIPEEVVRPINEFSYIPAGIITEFNGETFDNEDQLASSLAILLNSTLNNTLYYGSLYQYKTSLYNSVDSQRLVIIPKRVDKNATFTDPLYGGDVVINPVGYKTKAQQPGQWTTTRIDVAETASVVGYRYENLLTTNDQVESYYPLTLGNVSSEAYLYNQDYTSLNNLIPIIIAKCTGDCDPARPNNNEPFTIARSIKQGAESSTTGWRRFLTNEYYIMSDRDKGEIWKLLSYNKTLIIYQKYSMYLAKYRDVIFSQDTETFLGQGDIFDRIPDEVVSDQHGYAGNQSQWCTFLCKHGAVHIDVQQGKVFVYNGELDEISNKQMRQYFYERRDIVENVDNPFINRGWTGGFDEKYNRLLLTRTDNGIEETLSYSFDHQVWVAYHDYVPNVYAFNRNGIFNIKTVGTATTSLYKMNAGAPGLYHQFPVSDVPFESYVEPIFGEPFDITKTWASIMWSSLSTAFNKSTEYDDTCTHILVYNDNQCSGIIELVNGKNLIRLLDNARNVEYTWKFNEFRDLVINPNNEIVSRFTGNVNNSNLNNNKVWFQKSKFISKFIAVRFIYDNLTGRRFHLQAVDVKAKRSNR